MSRHRPVLSARRLKKTAAVAAVGIAAAGTAGALASPAAAAGVDPWAAVRACESGGNYSINTGNGFYGAYQFTLQSWRSVGQSGLPSNASPAVQDQAARQLAARYGMQAWPVCGTRYGGYAPSNGGSSRVSVRSAPATSSVRVRTHYAAASSYAPSSGGSYRVSVRSAPATSSVRVRTHFAAASSDPSATPTVGAVRVLSIRLVGQTRPDVRVYQLALDRLGFNLAADGRFGRLTALSTRHFQAAHGLAVDGEAGPQTKIALLRALAGQH